ncbi:caspase family protein [Mesorhizobium australicum]|uniref:caspase family protein n=1 Tax=Mesorhizobium australicum TaxID=536018 RepID=UPI00333B95C6
MPSAVLCVIRALSIFLLIGVSGIFPAAATGKKAFVFGIGNYKTLKPKLDSPVYDADAIEKLLIGLNYNVTRVPDSDLGKDALEADWRSFLDDVYKNDDVAVYYSGHGVGIKGENYVVPDDADDTGAENLKQITDQLISIKQMMDDLKPKQVNESVWILDACRNNPFANLKALGSTGPIDTTLHGNAGTFIFYAASETETAVDRLGTDPKDSNLASVYTRNMVQRFGAFRNKYPAIFAVALRQAVLDQTGQKQRPDYRDDLNIFWCFDQCDFDISRSSIDVGTKTIKLNNFNLNVSQIIKNNENNYDIGITEEPIQVEKSIGVGTAAPSSPLIVSKSGRSGLELSRSIDEVDIEDDSEAAAEGSHNGDGVTSDPVAYLTQNAVFLGKKSTADACSDQEVGDRAPFGCDLLKKVTRGDTKELLASPLAPLTAVNIRRTPLAVGSSYTQICIVGRLDTNSSVRFSAIVPVELGSSGNADSDTIYYATIGSQFDCPSK